MHNAHRNIYVTSQAQGLYDTHFHFDLVLKATLLAAVQILYLVNWFQLENPGNFKIDSKHF